MTVQTRRAVYSVTETAQRCGLSRARFYDLIRDGVMPQPVYCVQTRRPLYTADLLALCVRVRETNTAIDGRYIIFYTHRTTVPSSVTSPTRLRPTSTRTVVDPLTQEMVETLRTMGVKHGEQEVVEAIRLRCPDGAREDSFEHDLRAVFDALRCREGG